VQLQSRLKELEAKGLGVAAISYDPPEILSAFSRQRSITFPLLSDAGSATIRRYGILNNIPEQALGPGRDDPTLKPDIQKYVTAAGAPSARMVGMAFPGTFVLDRGGRVTSRYFEDFYAERTTVASMILELGTGGAPVSATKVSSTYIDFTTYPSDAEVAPGNRFTIVVSIVPHARMHVYAPGASGYRIVTLTIDEQPFLRPLPVQYPASETYFFAPLKERVPIYQKPFTLMQDVVLEGTPQAQALLRGKTSVTFTGTLDYQACDDTLCYNPVSLPLTWTLSLRPLVTERPTPQR
jgi:peroxiredoxin